VNRTHSTRLRASQRRLRCLELRKAGKTYTEIGAEIGITASGAYRAVAREMQRLAETARDTAVQVRDLELDRLDALQAASWGKAMDGDATATNAILRIMERRARLLGLDAPEKVAPTSPDGTRPYTEQDMRRLTDRQLEDIILRYEPKYAKDEDAEGEEE